MVMKHSILFLVVIVAVPLFLTLPRLSYAATHTIKIYPTDDALQELYDDDNQTAWSSARNYAGTFVRPVDNTSPALSIRSDAGTAIYRIYRASIIFDTSIIPTPAEVQSATLNVYKINYGNNTPLVLTEHERSTVTNFSSGDWYQSHYGVELGRGVLNASGYTSFSLNSIGLGYLDRLGYTDIGVRTAFDYDDIDPGNVISAAGFASSEAPGTETDPYLEITYTVPDENNFPLYTQIPSPHPSLSETTGWAGNIYANGTGALGSGACGTTIAQCGCALSSLTMMGRVRGVGSGVDGIDMNPGNFNSWLETHHGYDAYGNIFWSRAADYFGTNNGNNIETPFSVHNIKVEQNDAIKNAISQSDKNVIGFSNRYGHYVYLNGVDGQLLKIKDPYWYLTDTSNDVDNPSGHVRNYQDKINRAVVYTYGAPQLTGRPSLYQYSRETNWGEKCTFV
jgi:hypothetical protein